MSDPENDDLADALTALSTETGLSLDTVVALRSSRGLTLEAVRRLPDRALRRALLRLQRPEAPRRRVEFRALHMKSDPASTAADRPAGSRRMRAVAQAGALQTAAPPDAKVAGIPVGAASSPPALAPSPPVAVGGLDPHAWTALGPGDGGGRTRSIVPDPAAPGRLWAGAAGGGVWRREAGDTNWTPSDDLMGNLAVCSLAISPAPDESGRRLMLAGTGEGFSNADAIHGAGIFWSLDGTHWAQDPSTNSPDFAAVNRIAFSADGSACLAATTTGLFRCSGPPPGAWSPVSTVAMGDVRFHPTDPSRAIAGSLAAGEAYVSPDGGLTWQASTADAAWSGRVEVTYALADPNTIYASVNMNGGRIFRSRDGGATFAAMAGAEASGLPAGYLGDQGWYANAIWAGDPANADAVIVGGLDLYLSLDGGATLRQISRWDVSGSVHADHHCIVGDPAMAAPGGPRRVYFGNDGGIFVTDDYTAVGADDERTSGWRRLDRGYGVIQFYGVAANARGGVIVGGAQDNGTLLHPGASGAAGWTTLFGGDGGWCAADPSDPNYLYGEYVNCQIFRSADGGGSADYICGQYWDTPTKQWLWKPAPYLIPDAQPPADPDHPTALFIAPFVLDPSDPSTLLAGGASMWRCADARTPNDDAARTGPSWVRIKPPVGPLISAIAISPTDSDQVWVGHQDGQIFVTANGRAATPEWRQIAGAADSPLSIARYCSSFYPGAGDPGEIYVSYAAYRSGAPGGNLWLSRDGGATWRDIGLTLPDAPVHRISRHPTRAGLLYAGTEIGLFASDDDGASWSPANEGPTNAPVYDITWMGSTLICTTHGRGMFSIVVA